MVGGDQMAFILQVVGLPHGHPCLLGHPMMRSS